MSAHKFLASGVDMVMLKRVLAIVIYAVGVVTSPGYPIIFSLTVSTILWVSDFCGLMSQTILQYVTFQSCGSCDFGTNKIVFHPKTLLSTLCASLTNSSEKDLCQTILPSPLTRCLYYFSNQVSECTKAFISGSLG